MPTYEYACRDCKKEFAVVHSIKEFEKKEKKVTCPHCKSDNTARRFTAFYAKTSKKS